jgi:hypothetical protein
VIGLRLSRCLVRVVCNAIPHRGSESAEIRNTTNYVVFLFVYLYGVPVITRHGIDEISRDLQGCVVDQFKFFSAACDAMSLSRDEAFSASVRHPASHLRHGSMMIRPAGVLLLAAVTPILV